MVGAGCVAADTQPAYFVPPEIKPEAAAEYIHAADAQADHRVIRRAEGRGVNGLPVPSSLP